MNQENIRETRKREERNGTFEKLKENWLIFLETGEKTKEVNNVQVIETSNNIKTEKLYIPPKETPIEKCQRIYWEGIHYDSNAIYTNQCNCKPWYKWINNYSSCVKIISNWICEKEFWEGRIQGYYWALASDWTTTCLCKEWYKRGKTPLCVKE